MMKGLGLELRNYFLLSGRAFRCSLLIGGQALTAHCPSLFNVLHHRVDSVPRMMYHVQV